MGEMMRSLSPAVVGIVFASLVVGGALPMSLLLHGPSGPQQADGTTASATSVITGKTLVVAMDRNIETMDPSKTSSMYGPAGMVLETLVTADKAGSYGPGLAEAYGWNLSEAGHPRFDIHLKQGVVFQDGTPLNAQAVKDVVRWYKEVGPTGDYGWMAYQFWSVDCSNATSDWGDMDKGVWVKDDFSLSFNCTNVDASLVFNLSQLYASIMSPTAAYGSGATVDEAHRNYGTPSYPPVGTGPYRVSEWVPGDHVTLLRFDDYAWGSSWYTNKGPAKIDKVIFRVIPDDATRFAAFESGNVQVMLEVPPSKVLGYSSNPSLTVITGPGQGVYYVEFNCQRSPWTSVDLRRAIGFAINRTAIVDVVWHGYASPGVNYLSPIMVEGTSVPAQYNYSFNLTKAAELFGQAGWVKNTGGWLENTSTYEELSLPLWTTNKGEDVMMAEVLQVQLQSAGVHVSITQYEEDTLRSLAAYGDQNAILLSYSWPRADILDWHFGTWAAGGGSNTAQYMDPVFDGYATNWTYAATDAEFSENATRAHERLLTMGPWAPVVFWHQIVVVHNNVTGWYVHPFGQEQVFDILDVDVDAPPNAIALLTPNPVAAGGSVILSAGSSRDDVGIVNWTWSFTDGGAPVQLWGEAVTYTVVGGSSSVDVTLTVRDTAGNTDSTVVTLEVMNAIPEFSFMPILAVSLLVMFVLIARGRSSRP